MIKHLSLGLLIILLTASNPSYGIYTAYEEDIEKSRHTPLICSDHIPKTATEDVIKGLKAAITVVATPLGPSYLTCDHVALVFEMTHPTNESDLLLRTVHFGGDGYSFGTHGRPIIDDAGETLKKIHRGKHTTEEGIILREVPPLYSKHFVFLVSAEAARDAFALLEQDNGLRYKLLGLGFSTKAHNCCTYAHRVLKFSGIDIGFDRRYIKRATNFLESCKTYNPEKDHKEDQSLFPVSQKTSHPRLDEIDLKAPACYLLMGCAAALFQQWISAPQV